MALTVSTKFISPANYSGTPPADGSGFKRVVVLLTGIGTAAEDESNVVKLDLSTLVNLKGEVPTHVVLERIEWTISGFNYVTLTGDHTSDSSLAVLPAGNGIIDQDIVDVGVDGTGDLLLSTDGGADGDSYSILINARLR